jgi:hypothetical protein
VPHIISYLAYLRQRLLVPRTAPRKVVAREDASVRVWVARHVLSKEWSCGHDELGIYHVLVAAREVLPVLAPQEGRLHGAELGEQQLRQPEVCVPRSIARVHVGDSSILQGSGDAYRQWRSSRGRVCILQAVEVKKKNM